MHTTDTYRKALQFAAKAHHGQNMPASELPYFLHISEVMTETLLAFCETPFQNKTEEEHQRIGVLVAILHDVVEDTTTTLEEIENEFGLEVKNGVWAMTKNETLPKEVQMKDSLEKLLQQPKEVQAVKLADRIVNLQEPPHYWNIEKRQKYREEAIFILEKLGKANTYLAKRLERKIEAYKAFLKV